MKGPDLKGLFRFWSRDRLAKLPMNRGVGRYLKAAWQEGTESENGPWGPFFVSATVKTGPAETLSGAGNKRRSGAKSGPHSQNRR